LAFPRAPRGSISIQVWGVACASVVQLVSTAVIALYALAIQQRRGIRKAGNEKGEPMPISATGGRAPPGNAGGGERKKEL